MHKRTTLAYPSNDQTTHHKKGNPKLLVSRSGLAFWYDQHCYPCLDIYHYSSVVQLNYPLKVLVWFNISNTQDFVSAPLENVNCKKGVLTLIAGFRQARPFLLKVSFNKF